MTEDDRYVRWFEDLTSGDTDQVGGKNASLGEMIQTLKEEGIRVNSVHPGYIWTPLVENLGKQSPEGVEAFRAHLDSLHPLGHVGEPDDIAYGIVYLASDESKFCTGSELVIDGGYTAK